MSSIPYNHHRHTHDLASPFVASYIAFKPVTRHSRLTEEVSANSSEWVWEASLGTYGGGYADMVDGVEGRESGLTDGLVSKCDDALTPCDCGVPECGFLAFDIECTFF